MGTGENQKVALTEVEVRQQIKSGEDLDERVEAIADCYLQAIGEKNWHSENIAYSNVEEDFEFSVYTHGDDDYYHLPLALLWSEDYEKDIAVMTGNIKEEKERKDRENAKLMAERREDFERKTLAILKEKYE
jgi:hypothetical protein